MGYDDEGRLMPLSLLRESRVPTSVVVEVPCAALGMAMRAGLVRKTSS